MNARSMWCNVVIFLIFVLATALFNLIRPAGNDKEIAEYEKREIQQWPEFSLDKLFHGQLLREYDNYFSDHFVFRNNFIELGMLAKSYKGIRDSDGISLVSTPGVNNMGDELRVGDDVHVGAELREEAGEEAVPVFSENVSDEDATPAEDVGELVNGESSQYLVIKDRAMLLYKYSPESAEAYAMAINRLQGSIDPAIRVFSMLVPSQVEFIESEKLRKLSDSQKQAIEHVYTQVQPNVTGVPVYVKIEQNKDKYVYFRTDHHWTALGAYYGYEAIAQVMGFDPLPLEEYVKNDLPGYLGTAYAATRKPELKNNPDTVTTYSPVVEHDYKVYYNTKNGIKKKLVEAKIPEDGRGGYAVFLGGDFPMSRITTDVDNGKRLLIIKDSYANAVVPFLVPHFQEIELIDVRYFKGNLVEEIKKRNITDVLFINGPVVTTYKGIANMIEERIAAS